MSDRLAWLEEWCPECRMAPGARCAHRWGRLSGAGRPRPVPLHAARGWRGRRCPTCKADPGESCRTPTGREATQIHAARLRLSPAEVSRSSVWDELELRGATVAAVPFSGRAGQGGRTATIRLSLLEGEDLVDVARWMFRDELAYALEAPIWDRYGTFAGHPLIQGTVTWTTCDRRVVIAGKRGGEPFEEDLS